MSSHSQPQLGMLVSQMGMPIRKFHDLRSQFTAGFALVAWILTQCDTYQHLYMDPDPTFRPPKAELEMLRSSIVQSYSKLQMFLSLAIQYDQSKTNRRDVRHRIKELQRSREQLFQTADNYQKHRDVSNEANIRGLLDLTKSLAVEFKDADAKKKHGEILDWLCNIDPSVTYNSARCKHESGTGDWLIRDNEEFRTWEECPSSLMWLHGKAGSGKSMLSSTVIKHLKDRCDLMPDEELAYYFFSFTDMNKQNVTGMLESLVRQLYAQRPETPEIKDCLSDYKKKGERPDIEILERMLEFVASEYSNVFIVVDGMDECPQSKGERKKLLDSLGRIISMMGDNFHIFLTSRKEPDIDAAIKKSLSPPVRSSFNLTKHKERLDHDMNIYMNSVFGSSNYDSWPDNLKAEAKSLLAERADGMFQYIYCQFEILQNLSSVLDIRTALKSLPVGLDETYDRALLSVNPNFRAQVLGVLKWLALSKEVLRLDQLAEAFILHPEREVPFDEEERMFKPEDLLKYVPSLVMTEKSNQRYDVNIYVRFIHFSVKEYLMSDRIIKGPAAEFSFTESKAHLHIGHSGLGYHLYCSSVKCLRALRLRSYAAKNWMVHLEMVRREEWPPNVTRMAAQALAIGSKSLKILIRLNPINFGYPEFDVLEKNSSLLLRPQSFTALLGLVQLTEMLLSTNKYLTQDDLGRVMIGAAHAGSKDIVQMLLDRGVEISTEGGSPLYAATIRENRAMVEFLLDRGANINAQHGERGSALQVAAKCGHLSVVQLLVRRGADVNLTTPDGECAITSTMTSRSTTGCFQFLLDNGVSMERQMEALYKTAEEYDYIDCFYVLLQRAPDVNSRRGKYGFLLQAVCARTHECLQAARLLLDRGAHVNAQGGMYGSALQAACVKSRPSNLIRLLVERGADVNAQGGQYETALQALCLNRDCCIDDVQFLLDKGTDVKIKGGKYGNALQAACARRSSVEVVRLLLDCGADVNAEGGEYGTALQAACHGPNDKIVRLLLDYGADVNAGGGRFGSPLLCAVANSRTTTVLQTLLSRGAKVNNQVGPYGNALQAACNSSYFCLDKAQLLLDHGADINANVDKGWGTALQIACAADNIPLVRLLIDNGADINAEGDLYGTALQAACSGNNVDMVRLLIDNGANINARGGKFGSAWHAAAAHWRPGSEDMLQLLLNQGANVNDAQGVLHPTALHAALELEGSYRGDVYEWFSRTRFLLDHDADINVAPEAQDTPLLSACSIRPTFEKYETEDPSMYVKFLLESCPNANVNAPGGIFGSALQAAAHSGQTSSIHLLLDRGANPNIQGGKYGSVLNAAAIRGSWDIVEMLLDAGADPAKQLLPAPKEEWLAGIKEEYGCAGVQRYIKFCQVHGCST